jgi:hypothetical protein
MCPRRESRERRSIFHEQGRSHAKTRRREEGGGANPLIDGDVAGESKAGWISNGNPRDSRSALSARLGGFAAYPNPVPWRCRVTEKRSDIVGRVGRGSVAPAGAGYSRGTKPSAHALGYHLAALRAWGHGLGKGFVTFAALTRWLRPLCGSPCADIRKNGSLAPS